MAFSVMMGMLRKTHQWKKQISTTGVRNFCTQAERYINWEPYLNKEIRTQHHDHCWAVGSIECLEAVYKLYTEETVVLSPQHIIDKAPREKEKSQLKEFEKGQNSDGGSVRDVYMFIQRNGVALESDWPYQTGVINENGRKTVIGGYGSVFGRNNIQKLLRIHPLVGCIAYHPLVQYYRSGDIMDNNRMSFFKGTRWSNGSHPTCRNGTCQNVGNRVDEFCSICGYTKGFHTIVLMGYDTRVVGEHHWLIRNFYGKNWGENGCGKVKMTEGKQDITEEAITEAFEQNIPFGVMNVELMAMYPIPHSSWKKRKGLNWTHHL